MLSGSTCKLRCRTSETSRFASSWAESPSWLKRAKRRANRVRLDAVTWAILPSAAETATTWIPRLQLERRVGPGRQLGSPR